MDSNQRVTGLVFFGLGAGATIEIVAQEAVTGMTGWLAILMAGGILAGLSLAVWTAARWPIEFQATLAIVLLFFGFLYWGAWLTGPVEITSDLRVTESLTAYERSRIRAAGVILIGIMAGILAWVGNARGWPARDD